MVVYYTNRFRTPIRASRQCVQGERLRYAERGRECDAEVIWEVRRADVGVKTNTPKIFSSGCLFASHTPLSFPSPNN